jgi:hypothetical protein
MLKQKRMNTGPHKICWGIRDEINRSLHECENGILTTRTGSSYTPKEYNTFRIRALNLESTHGTGVKGRSSNSSQVLRTAKPATNFVRAAHQRSERGYIYCYYRRSIKLSFLPNARLAKSCQWLGLYSAFRTHFPLALEPLSNVAIAFNVSLNSMVA